MALILALIGSILWAAFITFVFYIRQTPEARVHQRMQLLIRRAEAERAKNARLKEADKPKVVVKKSARQSFFQRVIKPILLWIVDALNQLTPSAIIKLFENQIFRAGKQGVWNVKKFSAAWIVSIAAGFFASLMILRKLDLIFTQEILVLAFGTILGAALPFLFLNSKIRKRKKELKKQLPEFLDLLCVSVQAGLSFDGAVSKIVVQMKGSLVDEFKHMQDDIKFGMTKQYAMTQMAKRCDLEEVYLFTTSIIQAEKLGTSMSQTLSIQADNMRERHRQYVKTEAMKAPVKILFPMVLFIFPAIFVVLLFPALLTLIKTLGK